MEKTKSTTEILTAFATHLGMPEITKENAEEFYVRYLIYSVIIRASNGGSEVAEISLKDISDNIGFETEAPSTTDAEFDRWIGDCMRSMATQSARMEHLRTRTK